MRNLRELTACLALLSLSAAPASSRARPAGRGCRAGRRGHGARRRDRPGRGQPTWAVRVPPRARGSRGLRDPLTQRNTRQAAASTCKPTSGTRTPPAPSSPGACSRPPTAASGCACWSTTGRPRQELRIRRDARAPKYRSAHVQPFGSRTGALQFAFEAMGSFSRINRACTTRPGSRQPHRDRRRPQPRRRVLRCQR